MPLSEKDLELIKRNEAKFVSIKYIGLDGSIKQFDLSTAGAMKNSFMIDGKVVEVTPFFGFFDPFRSNSTTTLFCESSVSKPNFRKNLTGKSEKLLTKQGYMFKLFLSFFVSPLEISDDSDYLLSADPQDRLSDLRAEICDGLNELGIDCFAHYHGTSHNEGIIAIGGKSLVEIADYYYIARYISANVTRGFGYDCSFSNVSSSHKLIISSNDKDNAKLNGLVRNDQLIRECSSDIKKIVAYNCRNDQSSIEISMHCKENSNIYIALQGLFINDDLINIY